MQQGIQIKKVTSYRLDGGITVQYEPRRDGEMFLKVKISRGNEVIGLDYLNCKFRPSAKNAAYFAAKHCNYLAHIVGDAPIYVNIGLWNPEPEQEQLEPTPIRSSSKAS